MNKISTTNRVLRVLLFLQFINIILGLNPAISPGQNFDLRLFKLQLPVNSTNGFTGSPFDVNPISSTYKNPPYFYTSSFDGAMIFYAPYNGLTTSGSIHPRSELRELDSSGKLASWDVTQKFTKFSVTLAVNQLALLKSGGYSTVVVGQIHQASSGELWRLYYSSAGVLYWALSPPKDVQASSVNNQFVLSPTGTKTSIPLNAQFSYSIMTNTTHMTTNVYYGGVEYSSIHQIESYWSGNSAGMYFKAGCYCQVNNDPTSKYYGTGACQVSVYSIVNPEESYGGVPSAAPRTGTSSRPSTTPMSLKPSLTPSSVKPSPKPSSKPTNVPIVTKPSSKPSTVPSSSKPSSKPSAKPSKKRPTTRPSTNPSGTSK